MSIKFEETIAHINEKMRLHDERWKSATAQGRGTLEAELRSLREEKELYVGIVLFFDVESH
jgi:hypothetical protein